MTTQEILIKAKDAASRAASLKPQKMDEALHKMADKLCECSEMILKANAEDVKRAEGVLSASMIDRLTLTESRIKAMADGMRHVASLPSPCGKVLSTNKLPNGLKVQKVAVPIGVIAIIYESRPNVTSDACALSLKSGNVCILRGGKEAYNSARAIVDALQEGLEECGLPRELVQLIEDTTRQSAKELMEAVGYVDLLIPRGGGGLIRACVENAKVPCIQTGMGICHIFADKSADMEMALSVIENAKTSRPSVCNAEEVLLVHKDIAGELLPKLKRRLADERTEKGLTPVEFRVDAKAAEYIDGTEAADGDFDTEFLDYILAVKVVCGVDEAIEHIAKHSTHHSEAILTKSSRNAKKFTLEVDSAAVYVNASTRFTDGGEFGLGCEMGISTQKLHARGPMGLCELTTYKYVINGNGQTR